MYCLVLAALGDALTAIVGCAGLLAGVWFMARGSRADAGPTVASDPPPPPAVLAAAPEAEPPAPPPTTFRHGSIRLAGEPGTAPDAAAEPDPPQQAPRPPPVPLAPRSTFRQGRIRLGGLERGSGPRDEPPDAA